MGRRQWGDDEPRKLDHFEEDDIDALAREGSGGIATGGTAAYDEDMCFLSVRHEYATSGRQDERTWGMVAAGMLSEEEGGEAGSRGL